MWYAFCGYRCSLPVSECRCLISGGYFTPHNDTEKISERDVKTGFRETFIFMLLSLLCFSQCHTALIWQ